MGKPQENHRKMEVYISLPSGKRSHITMERSTILQRKSTISTGPCSITFLYVYQRVLSKLIHLYQINWANWAVIYPGLTLAKVQFYGPKQCKTLDPGKELKLSWAKKGCFHLSNCDLFAGKLTVHHFVGFLDEDLQFHVSTYPLLGSSGAKMKDSELK